MTKRKAIQQVLNTQWNNCLVFMALLVMTIIGCPRAKAAPLVSDGDEIASVGTVQVVRL